jgi:hypothetical protein
LLIQGLNFGSLQVCLPILQQGESLSGSSRRLQNGFQFRIANGMDEEVPPK